MAIKNITLFLASAPCFSFQLQPQIIFPSYPIIIYLTFHCSMMEHYSMGCIKLTQTSAKTKCKLFSCLGLKLFLFNSPFLFSLSPGLHALHAQDETPEEVKRRAGIEFCSIYHSEIFLLERHTLFFLAVLFLTPCPLPLTSHFCDMWSFHFILGWLSSTLNICCCPPISFCSIAGSIELHRPIQICS